jgi:hypothetical protein
VLRRALQLNPAVSAYKHLATAYQNIHQRDNALATLKEAKALYPEDFEIHSQLDKLQENPRAGVKPANWRIRSILIGVALLIYAFLVGAALSDVQQRGPILNFALTTAIIATFAGFLSFVIAYFLPSPKAA